MNPATGGQGFGATGQPQKLGKSGYQSVVSQQFTPEQMNLFSQMFGQVSPDSYLSRLAGGDQSQFAQLEQPAIRQFGELQSGLASRFAGMGVGANRSSGAQNAQTSAAQNFSQQLQSQRMGLQNQALKDLMSYSSELLGQRPYSEYLLEPQAEEPSFWDKLLGGLSGGVGTALGMFGGQAAGKGLSSLGGMFGGKKTGYQGNNADRIY
jgi:hypothetical protein